LKEKVSVFDLLAKLLELFQQSISGDEVDFSLNLTHPVGSEGDKNGVVLEKLDDGDPRHSHIEELFLEIVKFALGLMDLHELEDNILVDIVSDGLLDLLHVEVKLLDGAIGLMRQRIEDSFDQLL
jgi:hypothetical protein